MQTYVANALLVERPIILKTAPPVERLLEQVTIYDGPWVQRRYIPTLRCEANL